MVIVWFLLDNLFFLLVAAALLRAWMNQVRLRMTQQPGVFVMAVTDWLVKPLRRALPAGLRQARLDWGSLLAAALFALVHALLLHLLVLIEGGGDELLLWMATIPAQALIFLLRTALQGLMGMTLVYVLLSWVQPFSGVNGVLARLLEPLLQPLRRRLPPVGGVDLSALLLVLLAQVLLLVLT
ncbi:MAG: hypothetical protein RLZZ555_1846 [Pseudomonadota bacterium]|jgi:YggT family protein